MSILAQQMMLSELYHNNDRKKFTEVIDNPNSDLVHQSVDNRMNAFSSVSNRYPNNNEYFWSNHSVTVDDNGIDEINSSNLSVNVIG